MDTRTLVSRDAASTLQDRALRTLAPRHAVSWAVLGCFHRVLSLAGDRAEATAVTVLHDVWALLGCDFKDMRNINWPSIIKQFSSSLHLICYSSTYLSNHFKRIAL